jgi:spermidine synthase
VVALLVFVSGCAALVFQVAWMRELRLVFGATTGATAAVLAIFMAGLGIGSALLGKMADRVANPLRMYGLLEIAIAISAAVTPWLVALASRIYFSLGGQDSLGFAGATLVRLSLAAAIMAVPTILMGGTLPAAVRAVTRIGDEHRRALGVLYGSNTLGAVFGAAVTTFYALELLGTRATLHAGCALGLFAGGVAVVISRAMGTAMPVISSPGPSPGPGEELVSTNPRLVYVSAAVLGFTFFALELVWYRMLGPILGGTAFTFGLILCVALLGIGIGGIVYYAIFRWVQPTWSAFAISCGLEALATIVPFALGDRLALLAAARNEAARSFGDLIQGWGLVTCIVVFPAALVAGVQFPLLIALLGQGRAAVSRHVGMTYAWNTFGAITGSLVAGFGGMPLLTAPGMWQAVAVVLVLLSLGILLASRTSPGPGEGPGEGRSQTIQRRYHPSGRAVAVVGILAAASVALSFAPGPSVVWRHSGIGARRAILPLGHPNLMRQWANERHHVLKWEAEGIESSIAIIGQNGLAFVVNGKTDGNSLEDSATQIGVSILAAVLHDDPKSALVIGLGTGESAGRLADMRNIERVDVVELEPAIDEMARRCKELNADVLNHPDVHRIYNDGREYIFTTDRKYDLVISEPSNPYRAGIAALYTTEFYAAASERLNPGGLFIQWLQAYEVDSTTVHMVIATARTAFEHIECWQTLAGDLQLVCSNSQLEYPVAELRQRIQNDAVRTALAQAWYVHDLEGFLGHFLGNTEWTQAVEQTPFLPRNTDDCTMLEYSFAKSVGRDTGFSIEQLRNYLKESGYERPALTGEEVDWNTVELRRQQLNFLFNGQLSVALLSEAQDRAVVEALSRFQFHDFATVVDSWPERHREPDDFVLRLVLAKSYAELGRAESLELLPAVEEAHPIDAAAIRATYHFRTGDTELTIQSLEQYYTLLGQSPWMIPMISESAMARTIDLVKADRNAAIRLYPHLSRRFASNRFEYMRQLTRALVALAIDSLHFAEALGELEPHITWTHNILEPRAKAYAEIKHPFAKRAERDWQWYQKHRRDSPLVDAYSPLPTPGNPRTAPANPLPVPGEGPVEGSPRDGSPQAGSPQESSSPRASPQQATPSEVKQSGAQ